MGCYQRSPSRIYCSTTIQIVNFSQLENMTSNEPIKILVTNQKGGVGKSTISANLAAYLAMQEGFQVALIDFDKQASSSRWTKKAPDVGIRVSQVEINYQSAGMALLSAEESFAWQG